MTLRSKDIKSAKSFLVVTKIYKTVKDVVDDLHRTYENTDDNGESYEDLSSEIGKLPDSKQRQILRTMVEISESESGYEHKICESGLRQIVQVLCETLPDYPAAIDTAIKDC